MNGHYDLGRLFSRASSEVISNTCVVILHILYIYFNKSEAAIQILQSQWLGMRVGGRHIEQVRMAFRGLWLQVWVAPLCHRPQAGSRG